MGEIEGDVMDASTGLGVAGARVRIQSGQDEPLFTNADAQGHFRFSGLEIRTYQADASYPGYMSPRDAARVSGGKTVYLGTFHPGAEVQLEIQRYGVIIGKVTDAVGVAVAGAPVAALQRFPAGERGHGSCGLGSNDGVSQYLGQLCVQTNDLGNTAWDRSQRDRITSAPTRSLGTANRPRACRTTPANAPRSIRTP
jgi:hypothetical protein